jgi:hypothetical protein
MLMIRCGFTWEREIRKFDSTEITAESAELLRQIVGQQHVVHDGKGLVDAELHVQERVVDLELGLLLLLRLGSGTLRGCRTLLGDLRHCVEIGAW